MGLRHRGRLAWLLIAAAVLLNSCTPAPASRIQDSPAPAQPVLSVRAPAPTSTSSPTPRSTSTGGTLVIPIEREPVTLDPAHASTPEESMILRFLGASLISQDKDGNYVPYLAEAWGSSPDGLTWVFRLKDNLHFQNNAPLTARDVQYSIERLLNPDTGSPYGKMLGEVSSVELLDSLSLQIVLKQPNFPLLYALSRADIFQPLQRVWVIQHASDLDTHPMSAGPYMLKEWQPGQQIVLERNPTYNWGPSYAHFGPAYLQTIIFRLVPDPDATLAGLEAGMLDVARIDPRMEERIRTSGMFTTFRSYQPGADPILAFNVSKPPFNEALVRIAFNLAIDRPAMVNLLLNGMGVPQYGPLSRTVNGYSQAADDNGYRYDLKRARSLMAQAGYMPGQDGVLTRSGRPLKLDLLVPAGDTRLPEMIREQMDELGVSLSIQPLEYTALQEKLAQGDYQVAVSSYHSPDADILYQVFHSSQIGAGNFSFTSDSTLDKILENTRTSVDPTVRKNWVARAQQLIAQKALIVPIFTPEVYTAVNRRVRGLQISDQTGALYWDDVYIVENP